MIHIYMNALKTLKTMVNSHTLRVIDHWAVGDDVASELMNNNLDLLGQHKRIHAWFVNMDIKNNLNKAFSQSTTYGIKEVIERYHGKGWISERVLILYMIDQGYELDFKAGASPRSKISSRLLKYEAW